MSSTKQCGLGAYESDKVSWFCLTGAPRSGTTMLGRLLNTHPDVGCLTEVPLSSLFRRIEPFFCESDTHLALRSVAQGGALKAVDHAGDVPSLEPAPLGAPPAGPRRSSDTRWRAWVFNNRREGDLTRRGIVDSYTGLARSRHGLRIAQSLIAIALDKTGPTRLGTKVPNLDPVEIAASVGEEAPNLRIVAIVRRPTDVVNSSLARRNDTRECLDQWHIGTIDEACEEWRLNWNKIAAARHRLGTRLLVVRYEDIVAGRADTMRRLSEHLRITPDFDLTLCQALPDDLRGYAFTPVEREETQRRLGDIDADWDMPLEELFSRYAHLALPLPPDGSLRFGSGFNGNAFFSEGLSDPEPWGCWTDGSTLRLAVGLGAEPGDVILTLCCHVWRGGDCTPFDLVVTAGRSRQAVAIGPGAPYEVHEARIAISRRALANPNVLDVEIQIPDTKPDDGQTGDPRRLGLGLRRIDIGFVAPS